jgi:amino acid adenylation domain-containing protein
MEDERHTDFCQLLERASALAQTLQERGLVKGDRVALLMTKSTEAIISLFATLIAGGIYVPLEPRWPEGRIEESLADCTPRFVITENTERLAGRIPSLSALAANAGDQPRIFELAAGKTVTWTEAVAGPGSRIHQHAILPEDPALILFTSGSTGRPKGVTLSHKAVAAFVEWSADEMGIDARDRLGCPSALNFDLSTFDIFNMALRGATCVLVPEQIVWIPRFLAPYMAQQRITAWYCVPSILTSLLAERKFLDGSFPDLRLAVFAGEVLHGRDVAKLQTIVPHAAVYNLYGPTETNVVTWHRVPDNVSPDQPVPIGHACPYAEIIFDPDTVAGEQGQETGDLLVAGDSLMSGYWGCPVESSRAWVEGAACGGTRELYYRTGYRATLNPGCGYVFVGRRDRQVKRRGYRIELDEIENALKKHSMILEVAVVSQLDHGRQTKIVAFVRGDPREPESTLDLRTHCSRFLPAYMMPDQIRFLSVIPKSSRGKTDYAALSDML